MRGALVLALLVACKGHSEPPPLPAPAPAKPADKSVHQTSVHEGFIVVIPKGGDPAAIEKLLHERIAAARLAGDVQRMDVPKMQESDRGMMKVGNPDLTDTELDEIQAGTAIAVSVTGEPAATLRAMSPIVRDAAVAGKAWVIDPTGGFASTAAQFAAHVPGDALDVRTQIQVHGVGGEGEPPFADTMGMAKLGFPELMVAITTSGQLKELTVLIDATAQTMIAHPDVSVPGTIDVDLGALPGDWGVDTIRKNGGSARAKWLTRWGTGEGHADQPLIELVPATGSGTEGMATLLDGCFGKKTDKMYGAKADDPELEAAAQRARKELTALRPSFVNGGVPEGEVLKVKAPFEENGQVEWTWIEVFTWKGDSFQGALADEPYFIKSVRSGSRVSVPFAKVADYLLWRADGSHVGGYSDEILKKREALR